MSKTTLVRNCYQHLPVRLDFRKGSGRTDQSFAESSDINTIMSRFERTGDLPDLVAKSASYADFSSIGSYHESLLKINDAEASFAALPADIRERFKNDPQALMDYCADPKNQKEGEALGLFNPAPTTEPEPPVTEPVTSTDPPTDPPTS